MGYIRLDRRSRVLRLMPKSAAKARLNASDGFLALDTSPYWTGIPVGFGESAHDIRDRRYMPPARSGNREITSENTADC
jgi:hypothetical protein